MCFTVQLSRFLSVFDSFDILSYRFELVKNFFIFLEVFSSVGCCRFCDSHIRLSHLFWLVNNFFNFFQNIRKFHFQYFKTQLPVVSISLLQQLVYLITGSAVCQQLFHNFQNCVKSFEILWCFLSLIGDS